jgi:hypothetical protein
MDGRITLVVLVFAISLIASETTSIGQEVPHNELLDMLSSRDANSRAYARRQIVKRRSETVNALLKSIEDNVGRGRIAAVNDALSALGDIQAVESVEQLVSHIGYPFTSESDDALSDFLPPMSVYKDNQLPTVKTLVKLGEPSISPVIRKLATTDELTERLAGILVLRDLRVPFIRERLAQAERSARDQNEKTRLQRALKDFDNWLPVEERARRLQQHFRSEAIKSGKQ